MLRPSSAPVAKASTVCSSKLDTTYMSMNRVPTPAPARGPRTPEHDQWSDLPPKGQSQHIVSDPDRHRPGIKDARVHCVVLKIRAVLRRLGRWPGQSKSRGWCVSAISTSSITEVPGPSGPNSVHHFVIHFRSVPVGKPTYCDLELRMYPGVPKCYVNVPPMSAV